MNCTYEKKPVILVVKIKMVAINCYTTYTSDNLQTMQTNVMQNLSQARSFFIISMIAPAVLRIRSIHSVT